MSALAWGLTSFQHVASSSSLALFICPLSRYETGLKTERKKEGGDTDMTDLCVYLKGLYFKTGKSEEYYRSNPEQPPCLPDLASPFKEKSLNEELLEYFKFPFPVPTSFSAVWCSSGWRNQNNIRELGKHGGFSFRSLKIQRGIDTNTRPLWRNHLLLLISSSVGKRGPRQEAAGSTANHVPESCQILMVAIGPHQSSAVSLWGFLDSKATRDSLRLLPSVPDPKTVTEFNH